MPSQSTLTNGTNTASTLEEGTPTPGWVCFVFSCPLSFHHFRINLCRSPWSQPLFLLPLLKCNGIGALTLLSFQDFPSLPPALLHLYLFPECYICAPLLCLGMRTHICLWFWCQGPLNRWERGGLQLKDFEFCLHTNTIGLNARDWIASASDYRCFIRSREEFSNEKAPLLSKIEFANLKSRDNLSGMVLSDWSRVSSTTSPQSSVSYSRQTLKFTQWEMAVTDINSLTAFIVIAMKDWKPEAQSVPHTL